MKILILGGTIFTRGRHHADLFPNVERLLGDRDGDLRALEGRTWDAVIDTCGYVPRIARASARLLSRSVGHYTFISTVSVYPDLTAERIDEDSPLGTIADPTIEKVDGETYGPLKALCEQAVQEEMPGRVLVPRPGLIVGPHDPSDRFTYWIERVAAGGEVLAPGRSGAAVQLIDARDLAAWTLRMVHAGKTGAFNTTGPDRPLAFGDILESAKRASRSDARFTWVSATFLEAHAVSPWADMPVWVPEGGDSRGIFAIDCRRAIAAGLSFRAIDETVRDTLEWACTLPIDRDRRAGITREREAELLAAWRADTPATA